MKDMAKMPYPYMQKLAQFFRFFTSKKPIFENEKFYMYKNWFCWILGVKKLKRLLRVFKKIPNHLFRLTKL